MQGPPFEKDKMNLFLLQLCMWDSEILNTAALSIECINACLTSTVRYPHDDRGIYFYQSKSIARSRDPSHPFS